MQVCSWNQWTRRTCGNMLERKIMSAQDARPRNALSLVITAREGRLRSSNHKEFPHFTGTNNVSVVRAIKQQAGPTTQLGQRVGRSLESC